MPRLFVAIDLPSQVKHALAALRDDDIRGRWATTNQQHLTLRFIGEVADSDEASLIEALSGIRASAFNMRVKGTGIFPNLRRPRILWVGLDAGAALFDLQRQIEQEVQRSVGLAPEPKSFSPHVTLCRLKEGDPAPVGQFIERNAHYELPPFQVEHFTLFRSILRPMGAVYEAAATFPLLQA